MTHTTMAAHAATPRPASRRAFTLIELLVVIAIISILAAILFPVFAQVRDKARATACLSNMNQIGIAVQMYVQDNDERLFFRPASSSARVGSGRSGVVITNTLEYARAQWWNLLMPYVKSNKVFSCPGDPAPPLSPDANGIDTIPRSYVAASAAENLSLVQIDSPTQTIVITEKWGKVDDGVGLNGNKINSETWLEPFDGDECMAGSDTDTLGNCLDRRAGFEWGMVKMANRHEGGMNSAFFDGHAKWLSPTIIWKSADLTGCALIHNYPTKQPNPQVCDQTDPGCIAPVNRNVCNTFYH